MIWTPSQAWDYVKGKIDDFYLKGRTLRSQYDAAMVVDLNFAMSNMDRTESQALLDAITVDLNSWSRIDQKLSPVLGYFGYTGMGFDPITWALIGVSVLAVASALYSFYQSNKIVQHSAAIKILASKADLSQAESDVINSATSGGIFDGISTALGSLGQTGLLIVAGLLIYNFTKK